MPPLSSRSSHFPRRADAYSSHSISSRTTMNEYEDSWAHGESASWSSETPYEHDAYWELVTRSDAGCMPAWDNGATGGRGLRWKEGRSFTYEGRDCGWGTPVEDSERRHEGEGEFECSGGAYEVRFVWRGEALKHSTMRERVGKKRSYEVEEHPSTYSHLPSSSLDHLTSKRHRLSPSSCDLALKLPPLSYTSPPEDIVNPSASTLSQHLHHSYRLDLNLAPPSSAPTTTSPSLTPTTPIFSSNAFLLRTKDPLLSLAPPPSSSQPALFSATLMTCLLSRITHPLPLFASPRATRSIVPVTLEPADEPTVEEQEPAGSSLSPQKANSCELDGCTRSFKRVEHLVRHRRTHTHEKPYGCDVVGCDKFFARKDNLTQHRRTHEKQGRNSLSIAKSLANGGQGD